MPDSVTPSDIRSMSYVDFMAFLDETNRPPGGKTAIRNLIRRAHIRNYDSVLDIGCNTGFVSFELARVAECSVVGIDVNDTMIGRATERAGRGHIPDTASVTFVRGDATELPFATGTFDRVVCGGSTPFIPDRLSALREYRRVVRDWGFVGELNFFYDSAPPPELVSELNHCLGTEIEPWTLTDWFDLYDDAGFECYDVSTQQVEQVTDSQIDEYTDRMVKRNAYSEETREAIRTRLYDLMSLFNRNHKHLQSGQFVLRKRPVPEQISLFDS